jgi:hypothetical protein
MTASLRDITITDENGIVQEQFPVSIRDAERIITAYETGWMDDAELKEYLEENV